MSIQYNGSTIVFDNSWLSPLGTKTELCNRIYANFLAAGWSSVSVTGSAPNVTAFTVRSAVTSGGNLQCEVKCDIASTNCVRLYMQEYNAQHPQTGGMYLLPGSTIIWNMVINRYQFFIWANGYTSLSRNFAAGGILYLPTFLQGVITIGIWGQGNGRTDGDTTNIVSFRTSLEVYRGTTSSPNTYNNINGIAWENTNATIPTHTGQRLFPIISAESRWDNMAPQRWCNDAIIVSDPLIGWAARSTTHEPVVMGQLWDSVIFSVPMVGDSIVTFDGRSFIALTNNNLGVSIYSAPGTLLLAVS